MKHQAKKLLFWFCMLVCLVVVTELLALAVFLVSFHESFSYSRIQSKRTTILRANHLDDKLPYASKTEEQIAMSKYVIHPYYGYVYRPGVYGVNKFGFFTNEPQIQAADPNITVVAISGGSLAAELAVNAGEVLQSEIRQIPYFSGKHVVIINLANGAYKQPQSLIVLNDIISRGGHIDVLIELDGFNEVTLPLAHGNVAEGISPFFPQHWRAIAECQFSAAQLTAMAKLRLIEDSRRQVAKVFSNKVLKYSIFWNLLWRVIDSRLLSYEVFYRIALEDTPTGSSDPELTNDKRAFLGPPVRFKSDGDLFSTIAKHWARSSLLMNNIMATTGGIYIHLLQPNQYIDGTKPMGRNEKQIAINELSPYRSPARVGYRYLQAAGRVLTTSGVWFDDLTMVFLEKEQQLYNDDCCHLNTQGYRILADAIVTALSKRLSNQTRSSPVITTNELLFDDSLFVVPSSE